MGLTAAEREFLERLRVARLATVGTDGSPHVVPVVYAVVGDALCFVVDDKPKRTRYGLRRLRNIDADPRVAVVVDHYADDWSQLAYVLLHGRARRVEAPEEYAVFLTALRRRYPPYRGMAFDPRTHPMVRIDIERTHAWAAAGDLAQHLRRHAPAGEGS